MCKVCNVPNGILVGDGSSVQSTIVNAGLPAVFVLGEEVKGRNPWAIGTPSGAISEHLIELGFRAGASRRGRKVTGGPAWCVCDGLQKPGFQGNTSKKDYIRKFLEHGMIARATGEDFCGPCTFPPRRH